MIPKFRAWDNQNESMLIVNEINFYGKYIGDEHKDWYEFDRITLMQCTGRRGKNGTEIYEGDYLSLISFEVQKEFKGEVVFSEGSFCVVVKLNGHDYKAPLHELSNSDNLIEVLGNIYENPELLEEVAE